MQSKTARLEYWAGTKEYVFTDEHGDVDVITGEPDIRHHLTELYGPAKADGWLLLAHAMGPAGAVVFL
jgi:hypothetical protein